jgi:IS5 family transposase
MSLDISRLKYLIKSDLKIELLVPEVHPMIVLSNHIPWEQMSDVVIPDLYENKKMSGRKLNVRLHLAAFILQSQYKWTDRVLEDMIRFHGPTMLFCGLENSNQGLDHSQYTRFRNRISEESAKNLSTIIVQTAMFHGFTDSTFMDIDSTVQEASICYPSDISMLRKLAQKSEKILDFLIEKGVKAAIDIKEKLDFRKIGKEIKGYFFTKKSKKGKEEKRQLLEKITNEVNAVIENVLSLSSVVSEIGLPWNFEKDWEEVTIKGSHLINDIYYFLKNQKIKAGKILSLGRDMVTCIRKGKAGKLNEFGRIWFVAKIKGNYTFGFSPKDEVRQSDSESFDISLEQFNEIFSTSPDSVSADQGFWSDNNIASCILSEVKEIGIHPRGNLNWLVNDEEVERLTNRRASVEGAIGNLKKRGMGKSKMKSDEATFLEGQRSFLSMNLSRFTKDLVLREVQPDF